MRPVQVQIKRVQVGERTYDAVRVWVGNLLLSCDVVSDRTIKDAKAFADETGATFMYDDANAQRCREVLGIKEQP